MGACPSPFVCNENVMGAGAKSPWPEMKARIQEAGYVARYAAFDSKFYYILQTRERRYMIAVNIGAGGVKVGNRRLTRKDAIEALDYWEELLIAMRRPYTATFDQLLYSDNDPVVEHARRQLEAKQEEKKRHEVD